MRLYLNVTFWMGTPVRRGVMICIIAAVMFLQFPELELNFVATTGLDPMMYTLVVFFATGLLVWCLLPVTNNKAGKYYQISKCPLRYFIYKDGTPHSKWKACARHLDFVGVKYDDNALRREVKKYWKHRRWSED